MYTSSSWALIYKPNTRTHNTFIRISLALLFILFIVCDTLFYIQSHRMHHRGATTTTTSHHLSVALNWKLENSLFYCVLNSQRFSKCRAHAWRRHLACGLAANGREREREIGEKEISETENERQGGYDDQLT